MLPVTHTFKALAIFFTALILSTFVASQALSLDDSYVEQIVTKARDLRLHEERDWHVLLHYTKTLSGSYKSKIDDTHFFLSPDGRTDSKTELEATLRSFFIPAQKDGENTACRFPARYEWLKNRLDIDTSKLPGFTCTERDKAVDTVNARSAVLVFPVGHINSPASMFGHTLIRIDSSKRSNLISYAANYSADSVDTNGFLYAWKGLTGMYKGYYSMMPYYIKVKEYNDLEHRDMWEYRLTLSEDEVKKMVYHIWELQNINSSYYFLDENCSYNLLFLIEAARPELHLTEQTGIFVLPTHTVRIIKESGIVEGVQYRPSQGTIIRNIVSLLDAHGQTLANNIALSSIKPESLRTENIPDSEKMKILDLSAGYVQFRFARKEIEKDIYSKLYLAILRERSNLGLPVDDPYKIFEPAKPETGHGTTMAGIGTGVRKGEMYTELKIRPEFHGILDPDDGYLRGAQIKFFDTALRYDITADKIQLMTLHVVDIFSIAPRDMFFKSLSWKVNVGVDNEPMRDGKDYLVYRLNTGGGWAYTSPFKGILYALGELDVNAGKKIRGGVSAGPGFSVGDVEQLTETWKTHMYVRGMWYELGDDRYTLKATIAQNFKVTRNNSLSLDYSEELVNSHRITEAGIVWNHYF